MSGKLPADWHVARSRRSSDKLAAEKPTIATRVASQNALSVLAAAIPELIGGSADLTGSNNTQAKGMQVATAANFGGRYFHFGVREHGMAAAMNGMALHGGIIPYGGTFLVFTDYCRPAIRLSALMRQRVIYVMTHDSIGLGEDGPTHQPVEHLAALRAIPEPAGPAPRRRGRDAECWAAALQHRERPVRARPDTAEPADLRTAAHAENLCARGAYVLADAEGERQATLLATGSEVALALAAGNSWRPTALKPLSSRCPAGSCSNADRHYRREVLGPARTAASSSRRAWRWGGTHYIAGEGAFIGMSSFGASADCRALYKHFNITPEPLPRRKKAVQRGISRYRRAGRSP